MQVEPIRGPAVLFFYRADTSSATQMLPIIDAVEADFKPNVAFHRLEVDQGGDALMRRHGVKALPAIVVLGADGEVAQRLIGQLPRDRLEAAIRAILSAAGVAVPSAAATPLPALDPTAVALGRQLYAQHCAACHGPNAEGAPGWQTPDGTGRTGAPAHDDSGHTWHHGDAVLAEVIRDGMGDPPLPGLPPPMPAFGDRLSEQEITALTTYFKSLWSIDHRSLQLEETLHPAATAGP
jgi:mono/diheme cytochrome c family protein